MSKIKVMALALVMLGLSTLCFASQSRELNTTHKYLTDRDVDLIQSNWSDYVYAAEKVGVPVLILPAIHYRESNLYKGFYSKKYNRVIKNVGGPFMLDFGPLNDPPEFTRRIRDHEKKIFKLYGGEGEAPRVSHDFRFAVLVAAHHLKMKARGRDMNNESRLIDAVWGYNGKAFWQVDKNGKRTHKKSSYVWADHKNGIDIFMYYRKKDGTLTKFIDRRPGVMVVYKELMSLQEVGMIGPRHIDTLPTSETIGLAYYAKEEKEEQSYPWIRRKHYVFGMVSPESEDGFSF